MTAKSFSIPTTLPLMTEPSCKLPVWKDSSSIVAKSSRVGAAAVAMKSPVSGAPGVGMTFRIHRPKVPQTFGDHPESRMAGANTVRSERLSGQAPYGEARAGLCPPTARRVNRVLGPLGWPRRGRWQPGLLRLYPNAWYRASAHPGLVSG